MSKPLLIAYEVPQLTRPLNPSSPLCPRDTVHPAANIRLQFGQDGPRAVRARERASMSSSPLGPEAPFIWPHPMLDDDDLPANSIYGRVPSTQENRNTLTALSSQYNVSDAATERGGCFFPG